MFRCCFLLFFLTNILFSMEGFTTYNTKNNPKAKGLDLSIQIPNNYVSKETYRPNVALKFLNPQNPSDIIMVIVRDVFEEFVLDESNILSYCDLVINNLNSNNMPSKLFKCELTYIENLPATNMIYVSTGKRLNKQLASINNAYITYYKNYEISIMFASNNENDFIKMQDTYFQIINSFVVNDIYK